MKKKIGEKSNKKKGGEGNYNSESVILKKTGWKVKTGGRCLRRTARQTAGQTAGQTATLTTLGMELGKMTETKDRKDDTCACGSNPKEKKSRKSRAGKDASETRTQRTDPVSQKRGRCSDGDTD